MNKQIRTFFRVVTPDTFSNMEAETLESARRMIEIFGGDGKDVGEYTAYWKEQADKCRILKVTETTEAVE